MVAAQCVFLPLNFWDGESSPILDVYQSITSRGGMRGIWGGGGSFRLIPFLSHL